MKNRHIILLLTTIFLITVLLVGVALVSSCFFPFSQGESLQFSSNGQRIYYTATSSSGQPITYSGSIRMMHPISCVNCHGSEGKGGRVHMMMQTFDVPDITWHRLTEEEHHEVEEAEHEEHPPYTEETIRQAITEGINPAGEPLDEEMPRWKMSQQDLNDLMEFQKKL
ncbi:c-type cytochrome [Chloroflexota bacterium]